LATIAAVLLTIAPLASRADPISADPTQDKAHAAGLMPFALPTHGVKVNAILFTAAGAGRHSTVLLLHGLPGFEGNLDLARALQRDGWNVLTFHYRGNWGSPGQYSFTHCIEDARAALAWLHTPEGEAAAHVDPDRIVVIGHSLGGFAGAAAAAQDPRLMGSVLISAAPIGAIAGLPRPAAITIMEQNVLNQQGLHAIGDTTAANLADETIRNGKPQPAGRPLAEVSHG
jgi:pimeloyl-ACP methyl ester carboxylesterase